MAITSFARNPPPAPDPRLAVLFRRAASFFPTAVAVLSNGRVTMTVSSFQCVSFDPPLVSVALDRNSAKCAAILENDQFRARLLRHGEEALARGEDVPSDSPMVEMDCTVTAIYPAGDHHLLLAEVSRVSTSDGFPVVYWRRALHAFKPLYCFLTSHEAFQEFLAAWENGTLPKTQWTHAAHVAVGAFYAVQFSKTALERTRIGILRYNEATGTVNSHDSGYHETLTRLWSIVLAKVTEELSDPWQAACYAVARLGEDRDLHHLYYSFDIVRNLEARRKWIPPDLQGPY